MRLRGRAALACLLAVLAVAALVLRGGAPAPGQVLAPQARRPVGGRSFDIRDYGAVAGFGNRVLTRKAIQAAVDANPEFNTPHTVFVPADPAGYWVDRPVMLDRWIHLIGDRGGGSTLGGANETTPVLVGVPRQGYNRSQPLAAAHLDGGTGATFKGLYLDGGEHAYLWATPFSHGQFPSTHIIPGTSVGAIDAYTITDEITVEWQLDAGTVNPILTGPIMGLSQNYLPAPWCLSFTPSGGNYNGAGGTAGALRAIYATADGTKYGHAANATWALPGGLTGKVDLAVTMSPKQGKMVAWANGTQLTPIGGFTDALPAPGSKFLSNAGVPFQIAGEGEQFQSAGPPYHTANAPAGSTPTTALNRNFTGLRFRADAPYVLTNAAGSAQARVDAGPVDPGAAGSRYFTQEAGVLAWLPFTDVPADVLANRQFTVNFGNGTSYYPSVAGCLVSNTLLGFDWQHGSIEHLNLVGNQGSYGAALGLGYINDYTIKDCTFTGGLYGIGQIPTAAAYTLKLDGFNNVVASDVGLSLYDADVLQTGKLEFSGYGRACITSLGTSSLKHHYIYVSEASPQAVNLIHAANLLEVDRLAVDIEFDAPSLQSFVRCDTLSGPPTGLNCMIGSFFTGNVAPNVSLIFLDTTDSDLAYGTVSLGNLSSYGSRFRAVIETNGKSPRGQVEATQDLPTPWVLNSTPDGLSSITVIHRPDGFLRVGSFAKHSSILRPRHPADGQYTRWVCTAAGAYGIGSPGVPPRWVGLDPLDDSGAGLATYVAANYSGTSGNAVAGPGPVNSVAASQFLDGYFGMGQLPLGTPYGAALTAGVVAPPASVQAALIVAPGAPTDWYQLQGEATGGGYARVTAAFGPSSAGVIANSSAVTFAALSGTVGTVTGIAFVDPATGVPVAMAPVDPIATMTGTVVSFPIGALTIRSVPVPAGGALGPQFGYIAAATRDAFNNFYLRATTYTPPTGLQFALSTAPASLSAPTEPSGGSYARVTAPAFATAPLPAPYVLPAGSLAGMTANSAAATFPTPSGSWGTIKSLYLLDGSGTVIASGNVTIPRAVGTGSAAPTVAPGAFLISW